jgi:hypothetical protein
VTSTLTARPTWRRPESRGGASIAVAFSVGNGTFNVTNAGVPDFPTWAKSAGVELVARDFNGDGRVDLALTGVAGWGCVPVAISVGDGTFKREQRRCAGLGGNPGSTDL